MPRHRPIDPKTLSSKEAKGRMLGSNSERETKQTSAVDGERELEWGVYI